MKNLDNPKIAVLVDYLGEYQNQFLEPMRQMLSDSGFQMLTFVGDIINNPRADLRMANRLYDVVNEDSLDGIIVLAGISNFLSNEAFKAFLETKNLPVVVLGRAVEGYASVVNDQRKGMQDLMAHLCDECNHKHFAFIRGYKDNFDSQLREDVFRQELDKRSLVLDETLCVTGEFHGRKAEDLTKELVASGRSIDVIVAANDAMAIGAMQALTKLNICIPEDIAVVGFDNTYTSSLTLPPLTTVKQPIQDLVKRSVELLCDLLDNKQVTQDACRSVCLSSELIVRASCGKQEELSLSNNYSSLPNGINAAFEQYMHSTINMKMLLNVWQHVLKQFALHSTDYDICYEWLDVLMLHPMMTNSDNTKIQDAHIFFQEARRCLVNLAKYQNYELNINIRQNYINLLDSSQLWSQDSNAELMDFLSNHLVKQNINQFYIILDKAYGLTNEKHFREDADLVVMLSYHGGKQVDLVGLEMNSSNVVQELSEKVLSSEEHFVMFSLVGVKEFYGYMVVEVQDFSSNGVDGIEFEMISALLRRDISNAIQVTLKRQEVLTYASSLERLVNKRTLELQAEITKHKKTELELRQANTLLAEKAMQDGLTALNNRAAFDQYLQEQWLEHKQQGKPISLILCDIDHFKLYNDNYGHLQGDECLREVARILASEVHYPRDFVARYGGEEFAIVLPDTGEAGACDVAEKVHTALLDKALPHKASLTIPQVTLSMGICTLVPNETMMLELLILKADQALYQAKNRGRNNFYLDKSNNQNRFSAITYN